MKQSNNVTMPIIKHIDKQDVANLDMPSLFGLIQALDTLQGASFSNKVIDATAVAVSKYIHKFNAQQLTRIQAFFTNSNVLAMSQDSKDTLALIQKVLG